MFRKIFLQANPILLTKKSLFKHITKLNYNINHKFSQLNNKNIYKTKQFISLQQNKQKQSSSQSIISLSQQQIIQLSNISQYVTSVSYLQKNNLQQSLKYLKLSLINAKSMYQHSINLHLCLMNRISILIKLLGYHQEFISTLEEIFLMTYSLKGIRSLDTIKHLSNYLLALLLNNWQKGILMIQFITQSSPQFQAILKKHPKITYHFYKGLFQILNGNKNQGFQLLNQMPQKTPFQSYFKLNNLTWLQFLSKQIQLNKDPKKFKELSLQFTKKMIITLLQSENDGQSDSGVKISVNPQKILQNRQQFLNILNSYVQEKQVNNISKLQSIQSKSPQNVFLLSRKSHIISGNVAYCLFLSQNYKLALFFATLSLQTGIRLSEIDRVGRALILIAKIKQKHGDPQDSQKILLDILQNNINYTKNIIKECLQTYAKLLYKRGYFIQAQDYLNQANSISINNSQILGGLWFEGLILPQYDFSF